MPQATKSLFFDTTNFPLQSGKTLPQMRVAYETWGTLNPDHSNAILLFHALSGSHHAKGWNPHIPGAEAFWQAEMHEGWWENMIGPGLALDTNQYYIICANYLGGCYGSTGPASLNPHTNKPWGSQFPSLTALDLVNAQITLLEHLNIQTLHAVMGPSVGGLLTLTLATNYPERVNRVISIASGYKTTVLNRLVLFEQILAIENDKNFSQGDYYDSQPPLYGLALARMISHKTFVHLDAIERRARKDVVATDSALSWFQVRDQVQSYMLHQGKKFVARFDPNTYLRIIDLWAAFDGAKEGRATSPSELFNRCRTHQQRWLLFSIDSDFCFYPEEQSELQKHLEKSHVESIHITVHSDKGHDSFLLEPNLYTPHIKWLLEQP